MLLRNAQGALQLLHVFLLGQRCLVALLCVDQSGRLPQFFQKVDPGFFQSFSDIFILQLPICPELLLQLEKLGLNFALLLVLDKFLIGWPRRRHGVFLRINN